MPDREALMKAHREALKTAAAATNVPLGPSNVKADDSPVKTVELQSAEGELINLIESKDPRKATMARKRLEELASRAAQADPIAYERPEAVPELKDRKPEERIAEAANIAVDPTPEE